MVKRILVTLATLALLAWPALAFPIHIGKPNTLVPACRGVAVSPCYVDLTTAQINAVTTLLPAPGANRILLPKYVAMVTSEGSIPLGSCSFYPQWEGSNVDLLDSSSYSASGSSAVSISYSIQINELSEADAAGGVNKALEMDSGCNDVSGAILTSAINAPGLGYAANDTFTVDGNGSSQGIVDTGGALGVVTSYHLTTFGYRFSAGTTPTTTATSGIGTGLTLDVLTITPGNSTARVYLDFVVLTIP